MNIRGSRDPIITSYVAHAIAAGLDLARLDVYRRAVNAGFYTDDIGGVKVTNVAFDTEWLREGVR